MMGSRGRKRDSSPAQGTEKAHQVNACQDGTAVPKNFSEDSREKMGACGAVVL